MTESVEHCKTEFERGRRVRPDEPLRLNDLRWQALERFLSVGFPRGHAHASGIASMDAHLFTLGARPADERSAAAMPLDDPDRSLNLVFVNGFWVGGQPDASAGSDVLVARASDLLGAGRFDIDPYFGRLCPFHGDPFAALNTAFFADAACIVVAPGASVARPIHVHFVATGEADLRPAMTHPRLLIVLGAESRATVVECHSGPPAGQHLTNGITEIVAADGARCEYSRVQRDSAGAYHVGRIGVTAGENAECVLHTFNAGAAVADHAIGVQLAGARSRCTLRGLDVVGVKASAETIVTVEQIGCRSSAVQEFRSIVAASGTAVFEGRVVLHGGDRPHAESYSALQLSANARIESSLKTFTVADGQVALQDSRPGSLEVMHLAT